MDDDGKFKLEQVQPVRIRLVLSEEIKETLISLA